MIDGGVCRERLRLMIVESVGIYGDSAIQFSLLGGQSPVGAW